MVPAQLVWITLAIRASRLLHMAVIGRLDTLILLEVNRMLPDFPMQLPSASFS